MSKTEKKEPQSLEIDDDASIDICADYDFDNPLHITDPDPNMRYFFAANDGDKSRPDGVARVQQMGYRVSEKQHGSTDCLLMEIPRAKWDAMQRRKRKHLEDRRLSSEERVKAEIGNSAVNLGKDGGFYRSK